MIKYLKVLLFALPTLEGILTSTLIIKSGVTESHAVLAAFAYFSAFTAILSIKPTVVAASQGPRKLGNAGYQYQYIELIITLCVLALTVPLYAHNTNIRISNWDLALIALILILKSYKAMWTTHLAIDIKSLTKKELILILIAMIPPLIILLILSTDKYRTDNPLEYILGGGLYFLIITKIFEFSRDIQLNLTSIAEKRYEKPKYKVLILQNIPSTLNKNFDVLLIPYLINLNGNNTELIFYFILRQAGFIFSMVNLYQLSENHRNRSLVSVILWGVIFATSACALVLLYASLVDIPVFKNMLYLFMLYGVISIIGQQYVIRILKASKFHLQAFISWALLLFILVTLYFLHDDLTLTLLIAIKSLTMTFGFAFQQFLLRKS